MLSSNQYITPRPRPPGSRSGSSAKSSTGSVNSSASTAYLSSSALPLPTQDEHDGSPPVASSYTEGYGVGSRSVPFRDRDESSASIPNLPFGELDIDDELHGSSDRLFQSGDGGRSFPPNSKGSSGSRIGAGGTRNPPIPRRSYQPRRSESLPDALSSLGMVKGVSASSPTDRSSKQSASATVSSNSDAPGPTAKTGNMSGGAGNEDWMGGKTREELEAMLVEADRVIREREKDLGLAASIGKSLLEHNIALRAKHDSLLTRITYTNDASYSADSTPTPSSSSPYDSPSTHISSPTFRPSDAASPTRTNTMYGGKGDLFESAPPPSPSTSISLPSGLPVNEALSANSQGGGGNLGLEGWRRRTRSKPTRPGSLELDGHMGHSRSGSLRTTDSSSTAMGEEMFAMDEEDTMAAPQRTYSPVHSHSGRATTPTQYDHFRTSSPTSPIRPYPRHAFTTPHESHSFSSAFGSGSPKNKGNFVNSLSKHNAELAEQVSELEQDVHRADVVGKKRLRKLEKELGGLKAELEDALKRNEELEGKLMEDNKKVEQPVVEPSGGTWRRGWNNSSGYTEEEHNTPRLGATRDLQNDAPEISLSQSENLPPKPSSASKGLHSRANSIASMLSSVSEHSLNQNERVIVSQLMAKIAELQEANRSIAEERVFMDERLHRAQAEMDGLRLTYDAIEENVGMSFEEGNNRQEDLDKEITATSVSSGKKGLGEKKKKMSRTASRETLRRGSKESLREVRKIIKKGNRMMIEYNRKTGRTSLIAGGSGATFNIPARFLSPLMASTASDSSMMSEMSLSPGDRPPTVSVSSSDAGGSRNLFSQPQHSSRSATSAVGDDQFLGVDGGGQERTLKTELGSQWGSRSSSRMGNQSDYFDDNTSSPTRRHLRRQDSWEDVEDVDLESHHDDDESTMQTQETSFQFNQDSSSTSIGIDPIDIERSVRHRAPPGSFDPGDGVDSASEGLGGPWSPTRGSSEATKTLSRRAQALRRLGLPDDFSEDESFDFISRVDHEDKKQGSRGTDYYPVDIRARYAPNVVKTRVENASREYLILMMTWMKFAMLLIIAVVFAVYQGPDRSLSGRRNRRRLGT